MKEITRIHLASIPYNMEVEGAIKASVNGASYDKAANYHCTKVSIGGSEE